MKRLLALVMALGFLALPALAETPAPNATDYVDSFVAAGLPVNNIIVYTEETDLNNLLGRPGEYISKVNFADTRLDQTGSDSPVGGNVEVFASQKDMEKRKAYIEEIYATVPMVGKMYIFTSNDGLALLRLEYALTPTQTKEYTSVFAPEQ